LLFPTATFAIFFRVVLPLSWLTMPWPHRWRPFIIAASYVFYSWWDWRFVLLLAGCTIWNQLLAVRIWRTTDRARRKALLVLALAGDLGVLGYFKYYDFFVSSTDNMATIVGLDLPFSLKTIVLPVGISFFTFMAISYVVDAYRGDFEPTTFEKFAVYLSFFPHLVAGPIVRPNELIPQIDVRRDARHLDVVGAGWLILGGLFKKVVIANYLAAAIVDTVFGEPSRHTSLEIAVAIVGYAVQIYCDFSGYTDIAIGVAKMLGFQFPQNFDRPYSARSIQEFWRRWHMTLSRWLRDYLYIPLGGNRKGTVRTYVNLMVTMLLGGLWHGAAWHFVVWGGLHGAYLAVGQWKRSLRERGVLATPPDTRFIGALQWLSTFILVCAGWVFFRADSAGTAVAMLGRLVSFQGGYSPLVTTPVLLAIAVGLLTQFAPRAPGALARVAVSRLRPVPMGIAAAFVLFAITTLGPRGVAPFIYFRF
jgi:D-alanyl-lipoteichoic acid acyltransferase DltB (MBOAT superfamily)